MDKYTKLWTIALFSAFIIKLMLKGSELSDAFVLLCISAVYVFLEHKENNKQINVIINDIELLKNELKQTKESIDKTNNAVTGLKIGNSFKKTP